MKIASIKLKRMVTAVLYQLAVNWRLRDRRADMRWIVAVPTVITVIAMAWCLNRIRDRSKTASATATPTMTALLPSMPADVSAFYRSDISPLLDAALQRNRRAADRALASLHERFNAHRAGVKPFADDVAGWGTRFGVLGRYTSDTWDKHIRGNPSAGRVADYIQQKFRTHVLSEQALQQDVESVLKQYREDLEASRNQLYAEIRLPLRSSHSPIALDDSSWRALCQDINQRTRALNAATPRDSVATGLASMVGGFVGTEVTEAIVAHVLAEVGGAVALESAETATAAGGSAVASGTAGGGVGSLGGPAGAVIGVGVGLAVGAALDWWMSDRLEAHISAPCNKFLDTVEYQITEGSDQAPGLRASFEQAAKLADQRQRQAIIDALLEARK
jgi:hypothetical protein